MRIHVAKLRPHPVLRCFPCVRAGSMSTPAMWYYCMYVQMYSTFAITVVFKMCCINKVDDDDVTSFLPCSRGDAPVAPLPTAGEPAAPGPDPRPDGQERSSAAAQHRAGRAFPSTLPLAPGIYAYLCPDQLPVIHPRSEAPPSPTGSRTGTAHGRFCVLDLCKLKSSS